MRPFYNLVNLESGQLDHQPLALTTAICNVLLKTCTLLWPCHCFEVMPRRGQYTTAWSVFATCLQCLTCWVFENVEYTKLSPYKTWQLHLGQFHCRCQVPCMNRSRIPNARWMDLEVPPLQQKHIKIQSTVSDQQLIKGDASIILSTCYKDVGFLHLKNIINFGPGVMF